MSFKKIKLALFSLTCHKIKIGKKNLLEFVILLVKCCSLHLFNVIIKRALNISHKNFFNIDNENPGLIK